MKKVAHYTCHPQTIKTVCLLLVLFIFFANHCHAQIGDPGGDVDEVPIDGGLSLLVAAGIGYGAKRLKNKKQPTIDSEDSI